VQAREGFFNNLLHPRAAAGSSAGGQFTSGGGTGAKGSTKVAGGKGKKGGAAKKGKTNHSRAAKHQHGSLGLYAGYGKTGGDSRVKSVQAALNRLGVKDANGHALKLDGKLGPKTTAAIKAWQRKNKLPATGRVSAAMLRRLTAKPKTTRTSHLAAKTVKTTAKPAAKAAAKKPTTTHISVKEAAAPYGDVEYADPGYQADKQKRYPIDTAEHVRSAWSYINQSGNGGKYSSADLSKVKARIKAAAKKLGVTIAEQASEAWIGGDMSFSDVRDAVDEAVRARVRSANGGSLYGPDGSYTVCSVIDLTATDVVYQCGDADDLYQCSYSLGDDGVATLGDPELVIRTYAPAPSAMADEEAAEDPQDEAEEDGGMDAMDEADLTEAEDRIEGRVMEAAGTAEDGGRIFRVRIIAAGDSKNGRRYPHGTLAAAAPMYDGAKAYDHHRTEAELKSSTIGGIVGHYRSVEAKSDGLYGDLHLLPSATHAAEALDASLALQKRGLEPLIGISHDVMAKYRPINAGGRRMQEATQITKVHSADLVADPAAGGKATRMVAGGIDTGTLPENEEDDVPPTKEDVLGALAEATDEELAGAGLARLTEADDVEEIEEQATEATLAKGSMLGRILIRSAVEEAGLPVAVVESLTEALPDRITESDVSAQIAGLKAMMGIAERATLTPGVAAVQVTQESLDKKKAALDAFFAGNYATGYRSFKEAFADVTGRRPKNFDEDYNRTVLRESLGAFESGSRATESADSSTWNLILGDSITRRMVAEYDQPNLSTWRQVVSSVVPVNDFRTQRIDRLGGYGTLPAVNQGQPYQPLTTPTNEEVTYAITKRGGTEDLTLEMIANDDVRAIAKIPTKLGLAASQTLYRFVWELLNPSNNATIYDGNAIWTSHNNSATNALSQSALSSARKAMRAQTAYGDTADVLGYIPKTLVVCNTLEELAWQLSTSAVSMPSGAPQGAASNIPNIHQGTTLIVVDYWSSTTGWVVVADPSMCPTIEIGFYQGRETPELFTQSDPSVGSMFDADKVTYKIRHIYSGAVLDFRGFYRGNT